MMLNTNFLIVRSSVLILSASLRMPGSDVLMPNFSIVRVGSDVLTLSPNVLTQSSSDIMTYDVGNFGEVYVGQLSVPRDNEMILRTVAIKTIKGKP